MTEEERIAQLYPPHYETAHGKGQRPPECLICAINTLLAHTQAMRDRLHNEVETLKREIETLQTQIIRLICPSGDKNCPCPDGDMCHYEGPNPMTPPMKSMEARLTTTQEALDQYGEHEKECDCANICGHSPDEGYSVRPYRGEPYHTKKRPDCSCGFDTALHPQYTP